MNTVDIQNKLFEMAKKAEKKNKGKPFQCVITSPKLGIEMIYPPKTDTQAFHIASIGKLISTTALLKLVEAGKCSLQDPILHYLDARLLEGLFLSPIDSITLEDCLTHRSGASDFFEGKTKTGQAFLDVVVKAPNTTWTPPSLLSFAKENMKPVGYRQAQFAYGDTAFMCAMLVIEKITNLSLSDALDQLVFTPLGMSQTQSMIYTQKKPLDMLPVYIKDVDVSTFKSLSCDQADGGIVSTPHDLNLFQKALHSDFISPDHLEKMRTWQGKFRAGIHYGMGMMQIRFEEFFFLMKDYPRPEGHIGVLSTHSYYEAQNDLYIVLNFGSTAHMTQSFTFLSQVMGYLNQALKKISP